MDEIEQVKDAYREIGWMFLKAAREANEKTVREIRDGKAQEFWSIEIERALWPLTLHKEAEP
jgi:hypothetical protein